jgi:hypothetical protein
LVSLASVARADNAPQVRQFDIGTTAALGVQMYHQDQEAWKATDVLIAKHSEAELTADKAHGWIVESHADRDIVRFVRDGTNGPEISYDVTFADPSGPVLSDPQNRVLDPDELAQYRARQLALDNVKERCSDIYNTIALKDPGSDRWIVWALAATKTDPDLIIIGGHYRFTITADGKTIVQKDALSKSCVRFTRKSGPDGEPGQIVFEHVVSLTPIETHVFASLSYQMPFRIGTLDGKAWKVDGDNITNIDMNMPGIDGFAARQLAAFEENCIAVVSDTDHPEQEHKTVTVKSVIEATEKAAKYVPDIPAGDRAAVIACGRDDFQLAPNDYKVLFAGFPFMVIDRGAGHPKNSGTLYVKDGQFRFEWEKDSHPTEEQKAHIGASLDAFQKIPWPQP